MKNLTLWLALLIFLALAACSSGGAETAVTPANNTENGDTAVSRLNETYADALPVQSQLAIGTLQLETTDQAVDEAQAAELLPLWRAALSLARSDTSAAVEVEAVINQIQDTMTPAQMSAIAAMQITSDSMQAMIADGTLVLGRGGFGGGNTSSGQTGGSAGVPPAGDFPAGGGPGSGGGPGGGLGGDPNAMATRQAAAASGDSADFATFQATSLTNSVIRLLETKTGEVTVDTFGVFGSAITAVAQSTGLSEDDVRAAMTDGQTLAEILAANGGDVTAVTAELAQALQDSPMLQGQDPETFVTDLLNGSANGRPGN
ncbi:MAG: hypothetical protein KA362_08105 [Chloroflexi bacterium]|nr:hypothetical protein [Chloroflexota bacterium]MBK6709538.1 hypothetical protein [Chloroflexota bacterium]MBK8934211.1 hypothetical protein [Chloroflexota bacterium]MBP6804057.1 hypothetical protein [Chloroflexota bacterium]MBP7592543.1 hypothetical protein [Chloroflexota bacterium]